MKCLFTIHIPQTGEDISMTINFKTTIPSLMSQNLGDVLTSVFENVEKSIQSAAQKYHFSTSQTAYTYARTVRSAKPLINGLDDFSKPRFRQSCPSLES